MYLIVIYNNNDDDDDDDDDDDNNNNNVPFIKHSTIRYRTIFYCYKL